MTNDVYKGTSRGGRIWYNLGTAKTVRFIFVGMLVYFLIIGGLVLAYSNVQKCLADYSDDQATSSAARSQAAAIDRDLNNRVDDLSTSERARLRADQDALLDLVKLLADGQSFDSTAVKVALDKVEKVNQESADIGAVNDKARFDIQQERARADALRQLNPVPEAPSEKC